MIGILLFALIAAVYLAIKDFLDGFLIWTSYFAFALVIYYAGNKLIVKNDTQHLKWTFAFSDKDNRCVSFISWIASYGYFTHKQAKRLDICGLLLCTPLD